eukprot:CAMPEP_0179019724 /NCGR_PEP_ID=MMETSP0796-20121207/5017_1 /TAXON_ID=73915 /ORGANISM="Pyrodinium bahamense, Strain pbaha01" /LENGTH=435 /DNA_ID=CAMNT_0020715523 /DNA_START=112 /DNA_END=1416 /DNA_ORIENTATION=-
MEDELHREGWTKGLKRNVACCIARGSVIAHFDEGCLYSPDYLGRMVRELTKQTTVASGSLAPAAVSPSKWYTLNIAETHFRLVDLRKPEPLWETYGLDSREGQENDQHNHGFVFVYTRSAWVEQPFPDRESIGSRDGDFMKALKGLGARVKLADVTYESLAAYGWHRDATCGSKDVPANVNHAQVINFLMFRGIEAKAPRGLQDFVPKVKEIAADLWSRRERWLRNLVEEHGSLQVCGFCNFPIAFTNAIQGAAKRLVTSMNATDGYDMTVTYDKQEMKFDVIEFSKAGGAVGEGHWTKPPQGHSWIEDKIQRTAICRNCGFQLGWRYEQPGSAVSNASLELAGSECEQKRAEPPRGPVSWALIGRHLRERRKPGERLPEDSVQQSRHKETAHNKGRCTVCPDGHALRCFCTGQGNGGALPLYYICDVCDRPARG